ncbi:fructokinase, partial [Salmonella enterica subsp. enterica serovar Poona]
MPIRTVNSTLLIFPKNEERYLRIGLDLGVTKPE